MRKDMEVIGRPLRYATRRLQPGERFTAPSGDARLLAALGRAREVRSTAKLPPVPADLLAKFDHDGDGRPGGSLPQDPPALGKRTKAELIAIAAAEGLACPETDTVAAIRAAIEAHRAAQGPDA